MKWSFLSKFSEIGLIFLTVCCLLKLHAGGSGVRLYDGHDIKLFILVGWGRSYLSVASTGVFPLAPELVIYSAPRDLHCRTAYSIYESSFLIHHHGVYYDLFVCP